MDNKPEVVTSPPPDNVRRLNFLAFEEIATSNNTFDRSGKAFETDEADKARSGHAPAAWRGESYGYAVMELLPDLKGKPWNNLALSAVSTLRPSTLRVIGSEGHCHCDCDPWRVTVFLERDNRTIRSIEQEVSVDLHGCKNGDDFMTKLKGLPIPEPSDCPITFCNLDSISKIRI